MRCEVLCSKLQKVKPVGDGKSISITAVEDHNNQPKMRSTYLILACTGTWSGSIILDANYREIQTNLH